MFEKIRTKRLCRIVSKEIEGKGYCAWPVTGSSLYNVGVTLPDDIKQSAEEQNKFKNTLAELREKYKASIVSTEPVFSAGGVYASYLSVHTA